jgi:hypothetical protein
MKLIMEYVESAIRFEHLAALETNPERSAVLKKQAAAYYQLADERAKKIGVPQPQRPPSPPEEP